jgi:tetratricopeptide (TPR) repeat protein
LNKADFISLIEQPDSLGAGHIKALKHIAADFPYFQGAQLLLTKALYNEKHYEFEKQLKYASLMLPDRAVFFRYIHNLSESAVNAPTQTVVVEAPELIVAETIPSELQLPEEPTIEVETIAEPEPLVAETIAPVAIEKTVVEEIIAVPPVEPEPLEVAETPEPIAETAVIPPIQELTPNETHSFTEWLQLQAQGNTLPIAQPEVVAETPLPVVEAAKQPEPTSSNEPTTDTTAQVDETKSNVVEFESILDRFIRENPRISRGKAEFYSPMNMAKQSVEQDDELVSETLANVYYKQGHYKKAIRVYEKLCLLYPHKLSYFADLIQKIKTENKD